LLKYHPDKQTGQPVVAESTDSLFLSIQKAYDTLSDEAKRRSYDSQFEFDESIPSGTETTDFYKV
jgi:DnaJ-class molecular chaperone